MAWDEVKQTMSFREEILNLGTQEGTNIRELCSRFQISAKTFYKWLKRRNADSGTGLMNQSRRPHRSPRQIEGGVEHKILVVREKHPSWGARKIRRVLSNGGELELPSASTVHRVLQRNGKIDPAEAQKHQAWQRFEHEAPNQLWQMDFKGWFPTTDQQRCNPLTVLDDHSRYVVCLQACLNQKTETVQTQLTATFRRYGLPERMTMDNGAPWGNDLQHQFTPLTAWLIRLGVAISHSRPYHPQTQGKDERFHRTLDVDHHKEIRYRIDRVESSFTSLAENNDVLMTIRGVLTMRGESRPVDFSGRVRLRPGGALWVRGESWIRPRDWGVVPIRIWLISVRETVLATFDLVLNKAQ